MTLCSGIGSYGTYGPEFKDGAQAFPTPADIPLKNFFSCGDCVFPGVGVPAVAVSGANVANSCVSVVRHLRLINRVQRSVRRRRGDSNDDAAGEVGAGVNGIGGSGVR